MSDDEKERKALKDLERALSVNNHPYPYNLDPFEYERMRRSQRGYPSSDIQHKLLEMVVMLNEEVQEIKRMLKELIEGKTLVITGVEK